eukprot:COSAG02_NODE_27394_length_610_cov_2.013699_1_plen_66_part_00
MKIVSAPNEIGCDMIQRSCKFGEFRVSMHIHLGTSSSGFQQSGLRLLQRNFKKCVILTGMLCVGG